MAQNQFAKTISSILPLLGAAGGSFIPGVGTLAGGAIGGAAGTGLSALTDYLFGSGGQPEQQQQINRYNPQQQNALSQILGMATNNLQNPQGTKFDFAPMRAQAERRFNEQTVPSILERFNAMGGGRSSGLAQILGQAGAGLQGDLAAQEQQFGLQQQGMDLNRQSLNQALLGLGLTPQFDTQIRPREQSGAEAGIQNLSSLLPLLFMLGGQSGFGGMGNKGNQLNLAGSQPTV